MGIGGGLFFAQTHILLRCLLQGCWNLSPSSASGFGGTPGIFDSSVMWNSCNRIAEFLEILSRALSKQSQRRRQWKSKMHAICWNFAHICWILNVQWFRMATELRGAHANVAAHGHHDTIVVIGHRWVHLQTFSYGVQFFRILQTSALDYCTLTHLPRTKFDFCSPCQDLLDLDGLSPKSPEQHEKPRS